MTTMTKDVAVDRLRQACAIIFEVESQMDINKSHTRRIGYNCRISIVGFINTIKHSNKSTELKDL